MFVFFSFTTIFNLAVCYYDHHSRPTLHPTLHLVLPVSALLPLFWRSPVSSAHVRATSAFADVRRACALSTGGCWESATSIRKDNCDSQLTGSSIPRWSSTSRLLITFEITPAPLSTNSPGS
ncbi:hypothetical protein C8R48DRAFT_684733 [Suillus tomentosus]|nr:hypothetical protein C8R48DRAFT_736750 [Suillus tomentosus]KAG1880615.1 hypothetical protein C8R48DRAFT_684733 [Suillus tomentosus]